MLQSSGPRSALVSVGCLTGKSGTALRVELFKPEPFVWQRHEVRGGSRRNIKPSSNFIGDETV